MIRYIGTGMGLEAWDREMQGCRHRSELAELWKQGDWEYRFSARRMLSRPKKGEAEAIQDETRWQRRNVVAS